MIEKINNILFAAYAHGGDAGGPYGSNEKWMKESIEDFLQFMGLNEDYCYEEITRKHNRSLYLSVPQIVKKVN